jgi:hypothetical protein
MSDSKPPRFATLLRVTIAFAILFDLAFVGQKIGGAYQSEFGGHPDEAAHCVTALFVRDAMVEGWQYAAGGFQGSPVQIARSFAENFYLHYPKVALGVWPPAFHTVQALWTFPFGVSRTALLLLMAALAAATATLIFEFTCRRYGLWAASVAALLWLCGPLVVEHTCLLMAEMLSALTMFAATLYWGRYLENGRARDVLWFALLASTAILTKGTGVALVLMCALSLVLSRRWKTLARPSLWGAAFLVLILAGVWTWKFRNEGARVGGWEAEGFSWDFTKAAFPFYLKAIAFSLAFAVVAFAIIGVLVKRRASPTWIALGSSIIAIVVFQSFVPVGREARHILAATPALIVCAVAGAFAIARVPALRAKEAAVQLRYERLWILLLALLALPQALLHFRGKSFEGFKEIAVEFLRTAPDGARVLVSSDASGEGMFVSEVALRDRRPNMIVERASKSLVDPAQRDWAGKQLRERFHDDRLLLDYILRSKIEYVVLDAAIPEDKRRGYHDQLRRLIAENAGTFWPVAESPIRRNGEDLFPPVRLYRVARDLQPVDRR